MLEDSDGEKAWYISDAFCVSIIIAYKLNYFWGSVVFLYSYPCNFTPILQVLKVYLEIFTVYT